MRRSLLQLLLLGSVFVAAGCAGAADIGSDEPVDAAPAVWLDTELRDVVTGETFRISDFRGTPVFVESFAVWCPTCRSQLLELREVLESSDALLVALDTDPNEREDAVREHVERNDFAGRFAVAPSEMTAALLAQFGPEIVAVPTAPVILVSADQASAELLDRGVKSAEELLGVLRAAEEAR